MRTAIIVRFQYIYNYEDQYGSMIPNDSTDWIEMTEEEYQSWVKFCNINQGYKIIEQVSLKNISVWDEVCMAKEIFEEKEVEKEKKRKRLEIARKAKSEKAQKTREEKENICHNKKNEHIILG